MSAPIIVRDRGQAVLDTVPRFLARRVGLQERMSQAAPGLANGNDGQRQERKRREPVASGDVRAVAFEQQETPGSDALAAAARLLSVVVEMELAVDRIAKKPDSMAFALGEGV